MANSIYKGVLINDGQSSFLQGENDKRYLEGEIIWSGYRKHFTGRKVFARRLPQKDYNQGRRIILVWPDEPSPAGDFVDLYFNERLVKYPISFLGHLAVNVQGDIFNFSHMTNENEILRHEEYFFRPALGEFAPDPCTGRDNLKDPQKPYYDKFGRLFMRNVHILRIVGLDTEKLARFYQGQMDVVKNTRPDPQKPGYYADFNILTRSCSTIIRDGLRKLGFACVRGVFPRELFVNTSYYFLQLNRNPAIKAFRFVMKQLPVDEAPASALPPLGNPLNRFRYCRLQHQREDRYFPS